MTLYGVILIYFITFLTFFLESEYFVVSDKFCDSVLNLLKRGQELHKYIFKDPFYNFSIGIPSNHLVMHCKKIGMEFDDFDMNHCSGTCNNYSKTLFIELFCCCCMYIYGAMNIRQSRKDKTIFMCDNHA